MEKNWNVRKEFTKGIKGFIRVPEKDKRGQRVTFLLSNDQHKLINRYCEEKGVQLSAMIRDAIVQFLQSEGFDLDKNQSSYQDKNQLKIFE